MAMVGLVKVFMRDLLYYVESMQIDEIRGIMLTLQELLAMLRFVGYSYRADSKKKLKQRT